MGLLDFIKGAGHDVDAAELDNVDGVTEDKLLMAKLYRHLRNHGLEEKVEGLNLVVHNDRVTVTGTVANHDTQEIVALAIGNFQGVASVDDQLHVREVAAAPAAHPAPAKEAFAKPAAAPSATAPAAAPAPTTAKPAASVAAQPVKAAPAKAAAPAPAKKVGAPTVYHTVGEGSTLYAIAEKYLGDGNRYMEIFEANRPLLKNPDQLSIGQKLRIPQR